MKKKKNIDKNTQSNKNNKSNTPVEAFNLNKFQKSIPLWTYCSVLFIIVLISFLPNLSDYLVYDGLDLIGVNSAVTNFEVSKMFDNYAGESTSTAWRPFFLFVSAVKWAVTGGTPWAMHLIDIILHGLVTCLLFIAAKKIFGDNIIPFIAALLFGIHPIHTEAVLCIANSSEVICAGFLLGAFILYELSREKSNFVYAILSVVLYILAVLTKEHAVCFVGILVIRDLTRVSQENEERKSFLSLSILTYASILITTVLYLVLRSMYLGENTINADSGDLIKLMNPLVDASILDSVQNAFSLLGHYIVQLVYPIALSPDYSYNQIPIDNPVGSDLWIIGVLSLFALAFLAAMSWKEKKRLTFVVLFFFVTMALPLNIFIKIGVIAADRLAYLPSIPFLFIIAIIVKEIGSIVIRKVDLHVGIGVSAVIVLSYSIFYIGQTREYGKAWESNQNLFRYSVATAPNSYRTHWLYAQVLRHLGELYCQKGDYPTAERIFNEADKELNIVVDITRDKVPHKEKNIELKDIKDNSLTYETRGLICANRADLYGDSDSKRGKLLFEALDYLEKARDPRNPQVAMNMANLLNMMGNHQQAEIISGSILNQADTYVQVYFAYAVALQQQGKLDRAIWAFEKYIARKSDDVAALSLLAAAYNDKKQFDKALKYMAKAKELDPQNENYKKSYDDILRYKKEFEEKQTQ